MGRTWRTQEGSGEGCEPHDTHKHRRPGGLWQGHFCLHRNRRQSWVAGEIVWLLPGKEGEGVSVDLFCLLIKWQAKFSALNARGCPASHPGPMLKS